MVNVFLVGIIYILLPIKENVLPLIVDLIRDFPLMEPVNHVNLQLMFKIKRMQKYVFWRNAPSN